MEPEHPQGAEAGSGSAVLTLQVPADLLAAMDAYGADAQGRPDRPDLVLRIVRDWLVTNGYLRSDPLGSPDGGAA